MQQIEQLAPKSDFRSRSRLPVCAWLAVSGLIAGCGDSGDRAQYSRPIVALSGCIEEGAFSVTAFGAFDADIRWQGETLGCEGMQRPHGRGARLRFSGTLEPADASTLRSIAVILSIPSLKRGQIGNELPTRVTLIEEGDARFFSTREADICWSDIDQQTPMLDADGATVERHYIISGQTYCVAPVAELNGSASLTLTDLKFTGQVRWNREKK